MTTPVKCVLRHCQQGLHSPPQAVDLLQAPHAFPVRHPWSMYLRQQGSVCTSSADQYIIINGAKLFPFHKCYEVQISDISTELRSHHRLLMLLLRLLKAKRKGSFMPLLLLFFVLFERGRKKINSRTRVLDFNTVNFLNAYACHIGLCLAQTIRILSPPVSKGKRGEN